MVVLSVKEKLSQLGVTVREDAIENFRHLARITALKHSVGGRFHSGHWWRGPLLYALVRYYKPRYVLEFGTGRGYGAACMAQASLDGDFTCTVYTIDVVPPTQPQLWAINEGNGPEVRTLSLAQVWAKHLPSELTNRIYILTGDSLSVMNSWRKIGLPQIDFCFIDGGHDYWTVKHDFITALMVANPGCTFVFDDYTERRGYGVKRLVDQEIVPKVPLEAVEVIDILSHDKTMYGEDVPHKMALLQGEYVTTVPLNQFYSSKYVRRFMLRYVIYAWSRSAALKVKPFVERAQSAWRFLGESTLRKRGTNDA